MSISMVRLISMFLYRFIMVLRINYMPLQPTPLNKNKTLYEPLIKIIYLSTTNAELSHNKSIGES